MHKMTQGLRVGWIVAVALALIALAEVSLFGGYPIGPWVDSLFVAWRHGDCPAGAFGSVCEDDALVMYDLAFAVYTLLLLGLYILAVRVALIERRYVWLAGMVTPLLLAVALFLNLDWLWWKVGLGQLRVTLMILACGAAGPLTGMVYSFVSLGRPRSNAVRTRSV